MSKGIDRFTPDNIVDIDAPSGDSSRKVTGLVVGSTKPEEAPKPDTASQLAAVQASKTIKISEDDKAKQEQEAAEKAAQETVIEACPACGCELNVKGDVLPTDDDKTRWLRHVLGEDRFRWEASLFDGLLEITFRTRLTCENDVILTKLSREVASGKVPSTANYASPAYITALHTYMMLFSIERIAKQGEETDVQEYPAVTTEKYNLKDSNDSLSYIDTARDTILGRMNEGMMGVLMQAHRRFEAVVGVLLRRSSDPDFWNPAVGDS